MIDNNAPSESIEVEADLGRSPQSLARRWKIELSMAERRESSWRKKARDVHLLYTPERPDENSFNILWPNTETLRQALYNSPPQPQCRRRYSDEDPMGLKAAEVVTRALEFSQEDSSFDAVCQSLVLGVLLAGRSVTWERYVPSIISMQMEGMATDEECGYEALDWEQVISEQVQYDDFRILCAAKSWEEVTAVGRRHRLNRQDLVAKFGEDIGHRIRLDAVAIEGYDNSPEVDLFKTAEIWEIWDKETKRVIFISSSLDIPCKVEDDPLQLRDFFPCPRPLYAIEDNTTLVPTCLYSQYEQQAKELNRISRRINRLIDALRVRGVYDATISEMGSLEKAGDNTLIPSQGVTALMERGGLEKAIWMMPIETAAVVLKELYNQREATKQVIYELTGISDIMRSAANPNETFGAQRIKTQWGTQRLQRMQREVQRYIRDLMRIKAEIICQRFQIETLQQMTGIQLPRQQEIDQQKQMMMAQYQQQAFMAQMQGQQPPPPPQMPPDPITWDAVADLLRNDSSREFRIDIETDSTITATQNEDMAGLHETIKGIVELINGFAPAVQAGAVPIDMVKALVGVVVRRAKMGTEVEDAIGKFIEPAPQPNPEETKAKAAKEQEAMKQQYEQQREQAKMQMQMQIEQAQMQADIETEKARAQASVEAERARMQVDMQVDQYRAQMDVEATRAKALHQMEMDRVNREHEMQVEQFKQQIEAYKHDSKANVDMQKAELDSATKITVAQINAQASLEQAQMSAVEAANREVNRDLGG